MANFKFQTRTPEERKLEREKKKSRGPPPLRLYGNEMQCVSSNEGMLFVTVAIITQVYLQGVPVDFDTTQLLQVRKGQYVEISFSMRRYSNPPGVPCADDEYLEIRDGYNQSANLLGVFCGSRVTGFRLRSSGQNMWLKFSPQRRYRLYNSYYRGKAQNETGKY